MAFVYYLADHCKVPGRECHDGLAYITQIPEETVWEKNLLQGRITQAFKDRIQEIPRNREDSGVLMEKFYRTCILPLQRELGEAGEIYVIPASLYHVSWMDPIRERGNTLTEEEMAQLTPFSKAKKDVQEKTTLKSWWTHQGG